MGGGMGLEKPAVAAMQLVPTSTTIVSYFDVSVYSRLHEFKSALPVV